MHQPPDKDGFQTIRSKNRNPSKGNQVRGNTASQIKGNTANSLGVSSSQKKTIKDVLQSEVVYFQKQHNEKVLSLSLDDLKLHQEAWGLKERYFGNHNYRVQEGRLRYVYENILIGTGSVQIERFYVNPKDIKSAINIQSAMSLEYYTYMNGVWNLPSPEF